MLLLAPLDPPTAFEDWALRIVVLAALVSTLVLVIRAWRRMR